MPAAGSGSCRWSSSKPTTRRRPPTSTCRPSDRPCRRSLVSFTNRFVAPFRRSLRTRLVGYFLALSTVTVLVVSAITYVRATSDLTSSVYDRLDAIAGLKAEALDRWIDEQIRNVVFVG